MEYVRAVDFKKFKDTFDYQVLADMESCLIVCVRSPVGDAGPALHKHERDQLFYIVEGGLQMEMNGEKSHAPQGSLVFIPAGTPHRHDSVTNELHIDILVPPPTRGEPLGLLLEGTAASSANKGDAHNGYVRSAEKDAVGIEPVAGFSGKVLASPDTGSRHAVVIAATMQPGSAVPWHIHDFDQFYYVLEGALSVEIARKRYDVPPHHLVVLPAGVPHRNFNCGSSMERHLAILTPAPVSGSGEPADYGVEFRLTGVNF